MGERDDQADFGSIEVPEDLRHSPQAVFVMIPVRDDSGRIVELLYGYLNDAALALYRMQRSEVLGRGMLELFPASRDNGSFETNVRAILTQRPVETEIPWVDENGVRGAFTQRATPHEQGVLVTAVDVTATMLEQSEHRYRLLAEGASDVVYSHGTAGKADWVSPSVTDVLGWQREEFMSINLRDLIHPDDRRAVEPIQPTVADSGLGERRVEMRFATADGDWRWMSVVSRVIRDDAGGVVGAIEALRDVEAEVRIRERLAAQAERMALVLEGSQLGVWDRDLDTGEGVWDEKCAEILGYSLAELQPPTLSTWMHLAHPDDLKRAEEVNEDHHRGNRPFVDIEVRMRHRDGSWAWVRVRGRVVNWDDQGKPLRMAGTMENVTDRVEARRALERSEADLRAAQRLARLGSLTWDQESDRVTWSDELFALFGLDPAQGAPDFADQEKLYSPESWRLLREAVAETSKSGTAYEMDLEFVRADSTRGWLRVRGEAVLDDDGTVVGVQGQAQDVTNQRAALTELERSEQVLRQTQRMARLGSWKWDAASDHVDWSDELFDIFGLNPAQAAPKFAEQAELYGPAGWDDLQAAAAETLRTGIPYDIEVEIAGRGSRRGWARVRAEAVRDESGAIVGLRGYVQDTTEAKKAQEDLAASESLFRTAMLASPIGLAMTDLDGKFRVVNDSLCRLLGRDESWLLAHAEKDVAYGDDIGKIEGAEPGAVTGNRQDGHHANDGEAVVVRFSRADDRVLWVERSANVIEGTRGGPDYLLIQYVDTTDHHEALEKLEYRAFHDTLTGLRNRPWIMDMLGMDLQAASRNNVHVGVLFIDLDHFKVVNDSLGHAAGDEVLIAVASRIASVLRPKDRVGRSGGDEFIVVLPTVRHAREAELVADRIVSAVSQDLMISGHRIVPSVSIGIGLNTPESTSASLLRDADAALFRAKAAGRSGWQFFDSTMHADALARLTIEDGIRTGLAEHEFVVHYQPVVSLANGMVTGHEALVRWQHPTSGLLTPVHFISTAEDTGLIVGIGERVLDEVCIVLASMTDLPGPISINFSPVQFARPRWRESFTETLARYGVDPSQIVIEITETAAMSLSTETIEDLTVLRDVGVGIHVDDFGTGFSSISLLRDLPVTGLKLDASFVADLKARDEAAHALSAGLSGLVNGLHLMGIAEGVESLDQHKALVRHGWSHAQGYLFARPQPQPVLAVETPAD